MTSLHHVQVLLKMKFSHKTEKKFNGKCHHEKGTCKQQYDMQLVLVSVLKTATNSTWLSLKVEPTSRHSCGWSTQPFRQWSPGGFQSDTWAM